MKGLYTQLASATDGELARLNHESMLKRCWNILNLSFERTGVIESVIDEENKRIQFFADYSGLERLSALSNKILSLPNISGHHYLASAQIASASHHFSDARTFLTLAEKNGVETEYIDPVRLSIEQATGHNLKAVLSQRVKRVNDIGGIQNFVPLAALYADLGEYEKAHAAYIKAIRSYTDLSPFALAWVCFQLGKLHGETTPQSDQEEAAGWYQAAINYMPQYVHASVHLAEIRIEQNRTDQAMNLLEGVAQSGDPEVYWRLSQLHEKMGNENKSQEFLDMAENRFTQLLNQHALGFADHAVEFYLGSNQNLRRAYELSKMNLDNRPSLSAFESSYTVAIALQDHVCARELAAQALEKWGDIPAYQHSIFSETIPEIK
jgi:tetratricopeptide (TPR) repeat protein